MSNPHAAAPAAADPSHRDPGAARLSASIAICAYTEARWDVLVEGVRAVRSQMQPQDEIVLVVDHAPELLERAADTFDGVTVIPNRHRQGLSGARNTAVEVAHGDVVVFLDDDAVPRPGWLRALLEACLDDSILGVGGYVEPRWLEREPWWLPPEFLWVVGCSYTGLPGALQPMRNPIGASMAFRRYVFASAGLFSEALGRVGTIPVGCEETELSLRVGAAFPSGRIVHQPTSVVSHQVTPERGTFRYFRRRCWSEGISKAAVKRAARQRAALATERRYVLLTLRAGARREFARLKAGDPRGIVRVAVLLAGTAITAAGYLSHLWRVQTG